MSLWPTKEDTLRFRSTKRSLNCVALVCYPRQTKLSDERDDYTYAPRKKAIKVTSNDSSSCCVLGAAGQARDMRFSPPANQHESRGSENNSNPLSRISRGISLSSR